MATSLQVFHNLGCLREIVERVVRLCREHLEKDLTGCLDITALSAQQTGPQGKSRKNLIASRAYFKHRREIM